MRRAPVPTSRRQALHLATAIAVAAMTFLHAVPTLAADAPLVDARPSDADARPSDAGKPLRARPATTAKGFTADAYFEYFDGQPLQEAFDVSGWTLGVDLTLPFRSNMQMRLLVPFRTEADGTLRAGGGDVDIEGWGGLLDFATLYFEHQVVGTGGGPNRVSYFAGFGFRTAGLDTSTGDIYNHRGRSWHAGLRYDHVGPSGTWLLDSEVRYFEESDDLHPGGSDDDTFVLGTLTAAWIGSARGNLRPGVELSMEAARDYFAAVLIPEVIFAATDSLAFTLGVPVGVSSDAPDWGAEARLSFRLP